MADLVSCQLYLWMNGHHFNFIRLYHFGMPEGDRSHAQPSHAWSKSAARTGNPSGRLLNGQAAVRHDDRQRLFFAFLPDVRVDRLIGDDGLDRDQVRVGYEGLVPELG